MKIYTPEEIQKSKDLQAKITAGGHKYVAIERALGITINTFARYMKECALIPPKYHDRLEAFLSQSALNQAVEICKDNLDIINVSEVKRIIVAWQEDKNRLKLLEEKLKHLNL